jgi:hypothetical protein
MFHAARILNYSVFISGDVEHREKGKNRVK